MPPLLPSGPQTPPLPVAGAGTSPGQPPFGSSPVTMPTPNRGAEASGMALVKGAYDMLAKALPGLGFGTKPSEAVRKAMDLLAKLPELASSVTPGAQNAGMEQFLMERRQISPLLAQLAAAQGGGAGGAPPGGAAPPAPGG
jgi:hypothetical protein